MKHRHLGVVQRAGTGRRRRQRLAAHTWKHGHEIGDAGARHDLVEALELGRAEAVGIVPREVVGKLVHTYEKARRSRAVGAERRLTRGQQRIHDGRFEIEAPELAANLLGQAHRTARHAADARRGPYSTHSERLGTERLGGDLDVEEQPSRA